MHRIMRLIWICFLLFSKSLMYASSQHTIFAYNPDELKKLAVLQTNYFPTSAELKKWDLIAERLIDEKQINFYDYTRIFTYLYVAQAEAAYLSQQISGKFAGSLDPISNQVISYFIPRFALPTLYVADAYSQAIANIVFAKIKRRIERENALPLQFHVPQSMREDFSAGHMVARWIPWVAKPLIAYWPPAPPSLNDPIWKAQIKAIKDAQTPMTEEKKQIIYRWAGLAYPWSSDDRAIVNAYMDCDKVPFSKKLQVRSVLMIGLYDCVAAYTGCKYHYLVIRPHVYDSSVVTIIPVPKHPSYPSGHSSESATMATIMRHFFPKDTAMWEQMARECGLSRIWAGIHYPLDDQGGAFCGTKVAEKVLETLVPDSRLGKANKRKNLKI